MDQLTSMLLGGGGGGGEAKIDEDGEMENGEVILQRPVPGEEHVVRIGDKYAC